MKIVAPFVKLDYVRANTFAYGKPSVKSVVEAACQELKRKFQREDFTLKNPVTFVDSFPGVEAEENLRKIESALINQGCEVVKCPVIPRGPSESVSTVEVALSAEVVARVVDHLQNPKQADVIPLMFLGENKWTALVRVLSSFSGVEPWIVASDASFGNDLREIAQGRILLLEDILNSPAQRDHSVRERPRVTIRREGRMS